MQQTYKLKNRELYFGLFLVFVFSYALRYVQIPYVSMHVSNFALTGDLLSLTMYQVLLKGKLTKVSLSLALAFWVLVNIMIETLMKFDSLRLFGVKFTNFNTPDIFDAVFGTLAVAVYGFVVVKYCIAKTKR